MATLKDIAKILVEKHHIKDAMANEFLQQIVEVINEGLLKDRIVKIKGLGTFKLQEVKERGSVNINTGEPVVIAAHDKVTFTPDAVMRDLVNKPFAQFETVILNEIAPNIPQEEKPKEEKPSVEPIPEPAPEPIPEPVVEQEVAPTPEPVVVPTPEPVREEETEVEPEDEEPEKSSTIWAHLISVVVLAAVFFALGYMASYYSWFECNEPEKVEVAKPAAKASASKPAAKPVAKPTPKTPAPKQVVKVPESTAPQTSTADYNNDPRVKHGAYIITGTQKVVTVRKGQTLKGISKAYLGPDMECYVEAYNGKKSVQPGDKLLIPSLKHKKLKR